MSPSPTVLLACTSGIASERERICAAEVRFAAPWASKARATKTGLRLFIDRPQRVGLEGFAFALSPPLVLPDFVYLIGTEQTPSAGVGPESREAGSFLQPSLQRGH